MGIFDGVFVGIFVGWDVGVSDKNVGNLLGCKDGSSEGVSLG